MPSRRDFHKLSLATAIAGASRLVAAQQAAPPPFLAAAAPPGRREEAPTLRQQLQGTRGIVSAGTAHTVEAGTRMLAAGGNAFDAGVAAVLAAAVNEIAYFGLGGEAPVIAFQAATSKVTVVCGQGPAPKAAKPALFLAAGIIPAMARVAAPCRR